MFNFFSKPDTRKVLVSGIKPTGRPHIGNYFGAMKQNIAFANSGDYRSFIFIADYHALTTVKNNEELKKQTVEMVAAYIACGLNLEKAILFKQSDVPEHTELCWIFNNIVTVPYLMRAHAYKDHEAKGMEVNAGLFDYPVLMAADILMYGADIVPVGSDQKQHIEYARDIAGFYNRTFIKDNREYFKLPKELIVEDVATIPGIDGKKMSKSYGNHIELFCPEEELKKTVMSIVTDSKAPEEKKNPDENNIYNIHKHFLTKSEDVLLRAKFENGGYSYKQAKEDLLETIFKWRKGKIDIYMNLVKNPKKVYRMLERGGKIARKEAEIRMKEVRKQVGLDL
jgi:tryptophanyl-tRNA synthetase